MAEEDYVYPDYPEYVENAFIFHFTHELSEAYLEFEPDSRLTDAP